MGTHGDLVGLRVLVGITALPFSVYALTIAWSLLSSGYEPLGAILGSFAATLAILGWWFALRGQIEESRARMKYVSIAAVVVGGVGFVAGFFGPLLLTPNANQGPLVGILVTGPLGLVAGALLGWLYTMVGRGRREARPGRAG